MKLRIKESLMIMTVILVIMLGFAIVEAAPADNADYITENAEEVNSCTMIDDKFIIAESSAATIDNSDIENDSDNINLDDCEPVSTEMVGWSGEVTVGDGVTATFDSTTGAVELYSDDGTLWDWWADRSEIGVERVKTINVVSGTVYLPSTSSYIFSKCSNLVSLDLTNFDTTKVVNMSSMFYGCRSLKELDLSHFDTSKVTDMMAMFDDCSSLTKLDLSKFNTSNVTEMSLMFKGCSNLKELDLSHFDTSKVTGTEGMFDGCSKLVKLNLSSFDTSSVTGMGSMFSGCSSLSKLDLSSFDTWHVEGMMEMFSQCSSLESLDLSRFDTMYVKSMEGMFNECSNLKNIELSSFNTSKVENMSRMFRKCSSLTELDLSRFDTSNVNEMYSMFSGCCALESLDLSNFDTSKVYYMTSMFYNCSGLKTLNISSFNTTYALQDASKMFYGCSSLATLDLSNLYLGRANRNELLSGCVGLQYLKTPLCGGSEYLPHPMFDNEGNEYNYLPDGSVSIILRVISENEKTDISDYAVTLSSLTYTYSGAEKKPTATVHNNKITLVQDKDYTVSYVDNINAGKAAVIVSGRGLYKGEKSVAFTIDKANAGLYYGPDVINKRTTDASFTIYLYKSTSAQVTFTSSDTSVAVVDSLTGKVTIKGAGATTITASSKENNNYKAGMASYILGVIEEAVVTPTPTPFVKPTVTPIPGSNGFSDVQDPSHPYYKAIYWAADAGITKGYDDGTFGINKSCTRGEMIMFLWRFAHKPAPVYTSKTPFSDVPKYHTFYKAILWAYQKGITKGYGDGTFGVDRKVTRGESMMFLWRVKGKPAPKAVANSPFKDVPKTHVFYKAILWGAQEGITKGYTSGDKKGTFGINENCTRGHIVTFLYRAK